MGDEVDNRVEIAILKTNYENLQTRVIEVRDEMRTGMTGVNAKLDSVLNQIATQKITNSMRAKVVSTLSHLSAGALPLIAAKLLHIPISGG